MNPVSPCATISGNAPRRMAITGVPQAIASMATSELVSSAVLVSSSARAFRSRSTFWSNNGESTNCTPSPRRGPNLALEILLVIAEGIHLSGDDQRHSGLLWRLQSPGAELSPRRCGPSRAGNRALRARTANRSTAIPFCTTPIRFGRSAKVRACDCETQLNTTLWDELCNHSSR